MYGGSPLVPTEKLYQIIDEQDIILEDFPLIKAPAISLFEAGHYCIGLSPELAYHEPQFRVALAHETGHCMTNSFHNPYSNLNCVGKQEYKANHWAVYQLLPWDELSAFLTQGDVEIWQIAEAFSVTCPFVERALEIYQQDGLYQPPTSMV